MFKNKEILVKTGISHLIPFSRISNSGLLTHKFYTFAFLLLT